MKLLLVAYFWFGMHFATHVLPRPDKPGWRDVGMFLLTAFSWPMILGDCLGEWARPYVEAKGVRDAEGDARAVEDNGA